jgi:hypothetical protein
MDDRTELTEIDRALAEALDVDVSPDFAARVRRRIASEPRPVPFWSGWRIAVPVAAALAMAVGAAAILRTPPAATPSLTGRSIVQGAAAPADVRPARPVAVADVPAIVRRPRAAAVAAIVRTEPEVLVPREEIEMYRRLIAAAQRVPHAVVVEDVKNVAANEPVILDIAIDPIKIDLIVPPISGEGDRK